MKRYEIDIDNVLDTYKIEASNIWVAVSRAVKDAVKKKIIKDRNGIFFRMMVERNDE
jgi:hypothetical protein